MTIPAIDQPVDVTDDVYYPESDGAPLGETHVHVRAILYLFSVLTNLYKLIRQRNDVFVAADMFLYYERGNPKAQKSPDVMVIFGVDGTIERRTFKIWEENAVPAVIFEITSTSTWVEDLMNKSALYAHLGVKEYFIFDPLSEFLGDTALRGVRLYEGEYVDIQPHDDGSYTSDELGVRIAEDGHLLRVIDLETGKPVLTPEESAQVAQELGERFAELQAENERLRTLLEKYQRDDQ
jgi:Uma2 family endonuclease